MDTKKIKFRHAINPSLDDVMLMPEVEKQKKWMIKFDGKHVTNGHVNDRNKKSRPNYYASEKSARKVLIDNLSTKFRKLFYQDTTELNEALEKVKDIDRELFDKYEYLDDLRGKLMFKRGKEWDEVEADYNKTYKVYWEKIGKPLYDVKNAFRKKYQNNFRRWLKEAEKSGRIEIIEVEV